MATKKTTTKRDTKTTAAKPKRRKPPEVLSARAGALADLKRAVAGKDGTAKLLDLTDEAVLGHVSGVIPTGSLEIDRATGIGGWPQGRIIEVMGEESSGKTTLLTAAMANVQRMGGVAMLLDAESKFDRDYAAVQGVNVGEVQMIEADDTTIEAGLMAFDRALTMWIDKGLHAQGVPLLIGWDSVGASPAQAELAAFDKIAGATEGGLEKALKGRQQPGTQARAITQMFRVLTQKIAKAKACVICLNQFYEKIGGFSRPGMGPSKVSKGGRGLKYHATMRVELVRTENLKPTSGPAEGLPIGILGFARFQKNHLSMARNSGTYAIVSPPYGRGLDDTWTLFESLKLHRYITVAQGWAAFNTATLPEPVRWQGGFLGLKAVFEATPSIRDDMVKIFRALNPDSSEPPVLTDDEDEEEGEDEEEDAAA